MYVDISYFIGCPILGQIYQECPPCYATCSKPLPVCHLGVCTPGCGCPAGQVVDIISKKCVDRRHCPLNCAVSYSGICQLNVHMHK